MNRILEFYKDIVSKKQFYFPIVFYAIVGYSFSIYNRTVGVDDLMRDFNVNNVNGMLSGRWGMVLWCKILGLIQYDPFIDRFIALLLYIMAAVLMSFLFYLINQKKDVLLYTVTASVFITYPLINEIWEYTGVNFMIGGNLCMAILAAIILWTRFSTIRKRIVFSSLLLLLPISSYETAIFFYIALISIIILCENKNAEIPLTFVEWIKKNFYYFLPCLIALVFRFIISLFINTLFDIQYRGGGATEIIWKNYDFLPTLKGMIVSNIIHYGLFSLIYFPIAIFVFSLFAFGIIVISYKKNRVSNIYLSIVVVSSLFLQAIIQGDMFPYRHTQTITLFVGFVSYLLCISPKIKIRNYVFLFMFCLCWYQAVYLNRILGLNNLRSDNEVAIIHKIGSRIVSEFEQKPVILVAPYKVGQYINKQVSVDESSWNGRLFRFIYEKIAGKLESPYKYIDSNVNSASKEYCQIQQLFNYYGYDIEIILNYISGKQIKEGEKIQSEAIQIAKEKKIGLYQIYDNGNYLIVNMGGDFYKSQKKRIN